MTSCSAQFATFIGGISLKERHVDRIESATNGLTQHLSKRLDIPESDIFTQGSYANGTAVRPPASGSYDVDLIVLSANSGSSAKGALDGLFDAIADHGRYTDRLEAKTPCVRVNYADDDIGSFHVDVVPVRESEAEDAPLDAPRRNAGWHPTAPAEFTTWCGERGENFIRTVKTLKRWRNEQQDIEKAIKSIVLQVLTSQHLPSWVDDDADRLTQTLESMSASLSTMTEVPLIANPVLLSENLAARWSWSHFQDFRSNLSEAAIAARAALDESDDVTSAQLWKELLGAEFPLPTAEESGLTLDDHSHRQSITAKSWTDNSPTGQAFEVSARVYSWNRRRIIQESYQGGALKAGWRIRFEADFQSTDDVEVWWQVVNTGDHARNARCLRGGFGHATLPDGAMSPDSRVNWEHTEYTGSHLVQAFAVDRLGSVLAKSDPIRVDVRNPTWRFGRR
jgi:hypothetical protein